MRDVRSHVAPKMWSPREISIPDDGAFHIIADTREQKPLFTADIPYVIRGTVHDGDYTLKGFEQEVSVELKRLSDFMGYIGKERNSRTVGKLGRLARFRFAALVVIESEDVLYSPAHTFTSMGPEHVRGFLTSLHVRYNIHSYMNPSEDACRRWILDRLVKFYELKRRGQL